MFQKLMMANIGFMNIYINICEFTYNTKKSNYL